MSDAQHMPTLYALVNTFRHGMGQPLQQEDLALAYGILALACTHPESTKKVYEEYQQWILRTKGMDAFLAVMAQVNSAMDEMAARIADGS